MAVALRFSDRQINAWVTRNEKILDEASRTSARCAESALAALDTVIEELSDSRDRVRDRILRLTQAARNYFASTL